MKSKTIILATAILTLFAVSAMADVVAKHKTNFEMASIMSMEMTGTDYVKSDRSCSDMTSKMTGGMAAMMGKGKPKEMVNITRLDKGLLWELDPEKKHYTEKSLASLKEDVDEIKEEQPEEESEDEYVWTTEVKTVDQKQNINGFDCKGIIGKATGVKKKDQADTLFITYEQWMAENVPGATEMDTYHKNYASAIGVDEMWAKQNMGEMLKQYGTQFEELTTKMGEAGGYPIRTVMLVESPAGAGGDEAGDESSEEGGSMSGMMGKMSKMLAQNKEGKAGKGGRITTFSMTNEVLSVEVKSVPDSQFDVPEGYKQK